MKQDKSYQDRAANAGQLRKTAQQIHGTLKNDLRSLSTGMSYQFIERRDNWEAKNTGRAYFEREERIRT